MKALLTDGLQRKTLVATRSLGQAGFTAWVADATPFSLTRYSRHCRRGLVCPDPALPAFRDWLRRTCADVDVLLPMDDLTMQAAVASQDDLDARTLVPTPQQFALARDKWRTLALASQAGVPCPRGLAVEGPGDVERARREIGGEVVLRPRVGSGGRGVRFLVEGSPPALGELADHMVQERIPRGRKFDVGLLFDGAGDLRASFCQEELRWFPDEQGTSTIQHSVARPDLVALSLQLLQPVGWRGIAEVEWLVAEGRPPQLLEINPRPWASLGLAVAAGVDFPRLWAELALGRDVRGPESYDTGVLCRWSLPADLLHLAAHPLRRFGPQAVRLGPGERLVDDIVDPRDPGPVFGFAVAVVGHLFDIGTWRQVMRW